MYICAAVHDPTKTANAINYNTRQFTNCQYI